MKERFKNSNGQVAIITAMCLIAFVGMLALVIDMGSLYQDRRELQSVADAAALAGVQELPENPSLASERASEYVENNRPDITSIIIEIGAHLIANDMITVSINNPDSPLYFGRVFGTNTVNVGANATAVVGKPSGLSEVVPWGLEKPEEVTDIKEWLSGDPVHELKFGPGSKGEGESTAGNFRALDLDDFEGGGASIYYDRILDGYEGYLEVGDMVLTETGNKGGTDTTTWERLVKYGDGLLHPYSDCVQGGELIINNGQFVMVPVIPILEELPGKPSGVEEVQILAFVPFLITEINKDIIVGQFVPKAKIVTNGSIEPVEETGFRVYRLIK